MTTWEIPRLTLVKIHVRDGSCNEIEIGDFVGQIVSDEFFICGMESKPWWQALLHFKARMGLLKTTRRPPLLV